MKIKNSVFSLNISDKGFLQSIRMVNDPYRMNWVLSEKYLIKSGYKTERLFGDFDITTEDGYFSSRDKKPMIHREEQSLHLTYTFPTFNVRQTYSLNSSDGLKWTIKLENKCKNILIIKDFGVWSSFAYVMFRDKNVQKNIFNSAAVFPSISKSFTKIAVMRRSKNEPSIGMYQTEGETLSVGTYCQFENKFYEDVSPSLDGLLSHRLVFAGGVSQEGELNDWIYSRKQLIVENGESKSWKYSIEPIKTQKSFYQTAKKLGQPIIEYESLNYVDHPMHFYVDYLEDIHFAIDYWMQEGKLKKQLLEVKNSDVKGTTVVQGTANYPGEHVLRFSFKDGREDQVIYNVSNNIQVMIKDRVDYICNNLYVDKSPYPFLPESKQGESLGKMALVIKNNLLLGVDSNQIIKVEKSINDYVINKWFENGNFNKPKRLYGDFYRVMDFEYLGHLLYLLATVPDNYLSLQNSDTYLKWAAAVVELRINPEKHEDIRAKEESGMLGVFFLYINDLIQLLFEKEPILGHRISKLWQSNLLNVAQDSSNYRAAMTEHYYDNAGFGPAAAALAQAGFEKGTQDYGDLVSANIGFSNDFRAQNPDRWWEALTYMIHSLWGGVTAAAAYDVAFFLNDPELMEASYRATVAMLYCYDYHATATTIFSQGEAASTFAVSSPHENRLDLSRQRFGQDVFAKDGGIFEKLFESTPASSDWDMGEELVAYLDRFGQNAFCYFGEDGRLRGINCLVETIDNEYRIQNMAPYAKNIYLLLNGKWQIASEKIKKVN